MYETTSFLSVANITSSICHYKSSGCQFQNKSMEEQLRPKVGVGVVIVKEGKILLGKRRGAHGAGQYAGPGGHLEHLESIENCAKREVLEETGLEIDNIRFLCLSNLKVYAPKHYVDIGVIADWKS